MKRYLFPICLIALTIFALNKICAQKNSMPAGDQTPGGAPLDITYRPPSGKPVTVTAEDNLQAVLNAAKPGEVIELQAGAVFVGNFILPVKNGSEFIYIRTSTPDSLFPPPGTRVTPSNSNLMPKIITPNGDGALKTAPGAHHYRLIGIEFGVAPDLSNNGIVLLGDGSSGQSSVELVPNNIIIDRCYIHGNDSGQIRRGIALNSASTAIIDSYISNCHGTGMDTQAICGWNGPGPFKIINNYLEGAGENIMFGGGDPKITGLIPSDIEFRRNHCFKPLSWKKDDPNFLGRQWTVKNLFELKNAQRVLIDGNIFENNWADGQNGFAILFTPRNQDGGASWTVVRDVVFTNNIVRNTASAINIMGCDNNYSSQQTQRIRIANNLFEDVGGSRWGGGGRFLQVLDGAAQVVVENNTIFNTSNLITAEGKPNTGFVYRNNISYHNEYGVTGTGTGVGNSTLTKYFPGAVFEKNILVGGKADIYPANNQFPHSPDEVGFTDPVRKNYRLDAKSRYKSIGADIDKIETAIKGR
jgi:hypothetical protein